MRQDNETSVPRLIRDHLFTLPALAKFALGMVMLVTIPRLCRRLHVPAAVGLLLGGVIIGPYVLACFGTDRPIADFMAELGKLLLMFFAGLDIDLALFRRARNRSIAFGITTTVLPLCLAPRPVSHSATPLFPRSASDRCSHRTLCSASPHSIGLASKAWNR